jgi:uncharacterized protein YndB with AHSA1/START domain
VVASTESQEAPPDGQIDPHTVEVIRTLAAPPDQIWQLMISPDGAAALLGEGAILGGKGEAWRSTTGPHGVVRSYHPLEQLRVSWHADDDAPASLVELDLRPQGAGTEIVVRHEHVHDGESIDLHRHWTDAVDRLAEVAGT